MVVVVVAAAADDSGDFLAVSVIRTVPQQAGTAGRPPVGLHSELQLWKEAML